MDTYLLNKINKNLVILLTISPILSYFIVNYSNIKSGTYFFNALILLNFIFLLATSIKNGRKIRFPIYLRLLLLFSIYVILSDVFVALKPFTGTYFFKQQILFGFFAAMIIENTEFNTAFIKQLNSMLKWLFWISIAAILVQQFVDYNFFANPYLQEEMESTDEMQRRFSSIYSYLGGVMFAGFTVVPMLCIIVAEKKRRKEKNIWPYYLAGALFSLINKSRWILINWFLSIFVMYNLRKFTIAQFFKLTIVIVMTSISSYYVLQLFKFDVDGFISERLLETNHGGLSEGAASSRVLAFQVFADLYPTNPLFGKGNLKFGEGATGDKDLDAILKGRSSQIHVGYLGLFYMYGLIGAVLFVLFLHSLMKKTRTIARKVDHWGPYWGLMGLVVANITLVFYSLNVSGILLCIVYTRYYEVLAKKAEKRIKFRTMQAIPPTLVPA